MSPTEFLHALWGDEPPGLIQIWELAGKRSRYFRSAHGTQVVAGQTDVYTAVATAHKDHGRNHRAKSSEALAIAGLWLDLDVDGPHKTGGIVDVDSAINVAHTVSAPTVLVNSGFGLHAWYLFDEPWRFTSRADQDAAALASAQWYALHRRAVADRGWGLDSTHDLARLLRVPGTLNGKSEPARPVEVLLDDGPRTPRAVLLELAAQAGDVPISGPAQLQLDGQPVPDVRVPDDTGAQVTRGKVEALIDNVPEFAAAWAHRVGARAAAWSLSEYDLSLCGIAAQAGFTDQELADLIVMHRAAHGDERGKGQRLDYLQRTIAKVRSPSPRQTAVEQLRRATYDMRRAA